MGSIGEFAKGQQPMLERIKAHNAAYNKQAKYDWSEKPAWKKLLAWFGRKCLNIAYK